MNPSEDSAPLRDMCLAPWVHTYLSPQSERRMCCASREPATNFKQYIDQQGETGAYKPSTLEEHWNSEHMKDVRRRMMAGKTLPECEVCNHKLLNTSVYKDYFNTMFKQKRPALLEATDKDGTHHGLPVSFDYRVTNICGFKCRMCGPMLSSAWEAEERQNNPMFDVNNPWAVEPNRSQILTFQNGQAADELWAAAKEGRLEEIYWVGGEPLDWPLHWDIMQYLVDHDMARNVYVRYNTNLHTIAWKKNLHLVNLLRKFRGWQICASIDATHAVGEYIRTGSNYDRWLENLSILHNNPMPNGEVMLDLTLTLPGLVHIEGILDLVDRYKFKLLTKVVFSFSPDIVLSPLSLPRNLLDDLVFKAWHLVKTTTYYNNDLFDLTKSLLDTLDNLKTRKTFAEEYPADQVMLGLWQGKARLQELEDRRGGLTMSEILNKEPEIRKWYDGI